VVHFELGSGSWFQSRRGQLDRWPEACGPWEGSRTRSPGRLQRWM